MGNLDKEKISWKRHFAKTITYRIISSGMGFIILYITTGDAKIGAAFTFAEIIYKPFLYYIHERVWYKWIRFENKKQTIFLKHKTKENEHS